MFKTLQKALKVKEVRQKLLYTLALLVVVRIGCQIPIPGTDSSGISQIQMMLWGFLVLLQVAHLRTCHCSH